jgi:hypothetical protein
MFPRRVCTVDGIYCKAHGLPGRKAWPIAIHNLKVVKIHTQSPDWKRVIIIIFIVTRAAGTRGPIANHHLLLTLCAGGDILPHRGLELYVYLQLPFYLSQA